MKRALWFFIIIGLSAGLWYGANSNRARSWWAEITKPRLPAAENAAQALVNTITQPLANLTDNRNVLPVNTALPAAKNLAVPFTSQAPTANWDADHEEFCEEAAVLMVGRFYQGRGFKDAADAEAALQHIKEWELQNFGFYYDTTAAENARIIEGLYGLHVDLVNNPTVNQLQTALAAGHLVVVPAAGRELGNPNFKSPGPIYHNLVLRGYTDQDKFITNDPGTRKGEAYVYDEDVIMTAMHDWVPRGDRTIAGNGTVATGAPVVLIVSPSITP